MSRYLKWVVVIALLAVFPWLIFWRRQPVCPDAYLITGYQGNDLIVVLGTYEFGFEAPRMPGFNTERKDVIHDEQVTAFFFRGGKVTERILPHVGLHGLLQLEGEKRVLIHGGDVRQEFVTERRGPDGNRILQHVNLVSHIGRDSLSEPLEVEAAWWQKNRKMRYSGRIAGVTRLADDRFRSGIVYLNVGGKRTKVRHDYSNRLRFRKIDFEYRGKRVVIDCPQKTLSIGEE